MVQHIGFSKLSYLYLLFESVLNFVFFFSMKHNSFYIQLLYKVRYFVNNVMYDWNLILVLLTNGSSFINLEWSKDKTNISKFITYISKAKKPFWSLHFEVTVNLAFWQLSIWLQLFLTCHQFSLYYQLTNGKCLHDKLCTLLPRLKLMLFIK